MLSDSTFQAIVERKKMVSLSLDVSAQDAKIQSQMDELSKGIDSLEEELSGLEGYSSF